MRLPLHRLAVFSLLAILASALSCGREPTAPPGGRDLRRLARLSIAPEFPPLFESGVASSAVPFERVRIVLRREDGTIALDTTIVFPAGADSVSLTLNVLLSPGAPATGEPLALNLGYVNAVGDTVFKGGPINVTAAPAGAGAPAAPVTIPVSYTGTGSNAARVFIAPKTASGFPGDQINFSATAQDNGGLTLPGTPVVFTSLDPSRVTLDSPTSGVARVQGERGTGRVVAQLLTGPADTATVTVQLPPANLAIIGGNNQLGAIGSTLPQPLAVRVTATDGVGVSGVLVTFTVTGGGGTINPPTVTTDASGEASANWTLGTIVGPAAASVSAAGVLTGPVTFSATQQPGVPTKLAFRVHPLSVTAGGSLGDVTVAALDANNNTSSTFTGPITLALAGGPAGAALAGSLTVNATAGVATFPGLTVGRPGSGYTLVASSAGLALATSNPFNVLVGAAQRLIFSTQPVEAQAGVPQTAPVTVSAVDAAGNVVTSFTGTVTLALAANPGAATLTGTLTATAVNGVASFSGYTMSRAGTDFSFSASTPDLLGAVSMAFGVRVGALSSLSVVRGGAQSAPPGTLLPDTIVIQALDGAGNPLSGVALTFTIATGGGSVAVISATTNAQGEARARWTLGAAPGTQSLSVAATGLTPLLVPANAVTAAAARLFLSADNLDVGAGQSAAITIFLTAAQASPTTVTLTTADTNSQWSGPSVIIPAGATSVGVSILGRVAGSSSAIANAGGAIGADTLLLTVEPATIRLLQYYYYGNVGDSIETQVILSAPAPTGGLTVTFDESLPGHLRVVPSPGAREAQPCGVCGCGDQRKPAKRDSLTAPGLKPLYSVAGGTSLFIKQGELIGYIFVIPDSAGSVDLTPQAPGFGGQSSYFYLSSRDLSLGWSSTNLGLGTHETFWAYRGENGQLSLPLTVTSRNPAVATVPPAVVIPAADYNQEFDVTSVSVGTTWIVLSAPGWTSDSVEVTVTSPALDACCNRTFGPTSAPMYVNVRATDSTLSSYTARNTPLAVTVTSRDTLVARPGGGTYTIETNQTYAYAEILPVGVGSTRIVFTAPGHASDSISVTVTGGHSLNWDGTLLVGVGKYQGYLQVYAANPYTAVDAPVLVSLSSSNTAIATVQPTAVIPARSSYSEYIRVTGVSAGTATITASASGFLNSTFIMEVVAGSLVRSPLPPATMTTGSNTSMGLRVRDSCCWEYPLVAPLTVNVRSTDSTILAVDTILTIPAGFSSGYVGMRPHAPGTARLVVSAPGYPTDSGSVFTVTGAAGPRLQFCCSYRPAYVGRTQLRTLSLSRVNDPTRPATTATLTKIGSSTSLSFASVGFDAGATYANAILGIRGVAVGVDTIILTAAGYAPDTAVVQVTAPSASVQNLPSYVIANYPYGYIGISPLRDAMGFVNATADTLRFSVVSSDTLVAKPDSGVLRIPPGADGAGLHVNFRGPGTVNFTLTDLGGTYGTLTSANTIVEVPRLYFTNSEINLGTRQQTYNGFYPEMTVWTDYEVLVPTVVRLTRSATGLISSPDSVIIPAGDNRAGFVIASLDTVGGVQLTATSTGFAQGTAVVQVTRAAFDVQVSTTYTTLATPVVEVSVLPFETFWYTVHPVTEAVTAALSVDSATIAGLDSTSLAIAAGNDQSAWANLSFVRKGRVNLTASDPRALFRRYLNGTQDVFADSVYLYFYGPTTLGIGQRYQSIYISLNTYAETTTAVAFTRSAGAHTSLPAAGTVTIPAGNYYVYFSMDGVTQGRDTIVFTLPGFLPAQGIVNVQPGWFNTNAPTSLRVGDSVFVSVQIRGPDGSTSVAAASNTTLTLGASAGGAWSDGASAVTSADLAAGFFSLNRYLKVTAPGTITFTIAAPGYLSRSFSVSATP